MKIETEQREVKVYVCETCGKRCDHDGGARECERKHKQTACGHADGYTFTASDWATDEDNGYLSRFRIEKRCKSCDKLFGCADIGIRKVITKAEELYNLFGQDAQ